MRTKSHDVSFIAIETKNGWACNMLVHGADPEKKKVNAFTIEAAHPIEDEATARRLFPELKSYAYGDDEPE